MRKLLLAIVFFSLSANLTSFSQNSNVAKLVDKFENICCGDEKARLDNFAIQLLNEPETQGYIIFYEGRRYASCYSSRPRVPRLGEAQARAARMKPYLVDTRGFDANRLVIINGGYREKWMAELWIVPKGANPPKPTPTLQAKDVRFRKGKIPKNAYQCME
ncbi:MAG: hypothetical protein LC802_24410 [Acidobacteria bacterium]|nr:hypothetical protein [Acidobacteriota bacterium]